MPTTSKMGRPPGKKSDAAYIQLTSYITRNTHNQIKLELLRDATEGRKQDMSELIEDLLCAWLKKRKK